jgi:hypothetical protein
MSAGPPYAATLDLFFFLPLLSGVLVWGNSILILGKFSFIVIPSYKVF